MAKRMVAGVKRKATENRKTSPEFMVEAEAIEGDVSSS